LEFIATKEIAAFKAKKSLQASLATVRWRSETVHLAYPLTFMNLSGEAVALLVRYFELKSLQDLLIVVDDVSLPFGKFRLRSEGSPGGHNGLVSIEERLGSYEYPRLRIGIGASEVDNLAKEAGFREPLKDYVLSFFAPKEEKQMERLLTTGQKACYSWVLEPLTRVMTWVNATELM
jgi:PTH1 family peptidyl-tRNA hydrolase